MDWTVSLMQIYAKLSACEEADESTPDAHIQMQLTPSDSFVILLRCQSDAHALATCNERIILSFSS